MRKNRMFWIVLASISLLISTLASFQGEAYAQAEKWGNIDWKQFEGAELNVLVTGTTMGRNYQKRIDQFEELTGIKVKFELLNDVDRKKKQLVDYTSGMGEYDVANIGFSNREEFAQPDYLVDLKPYLDDPKLTDKAWYDFEDYPEDLIAAGYANNGKLVFIPYTGEYFLFWYRKDIFQELGLSVPKNFQEMRETAQKLEDARKAGKIEQYGWIERQMPGASEAGWNLFCTANRFGVDFIDFDKKISYVNTPKGREILAYYTSMIKDFAPPGSGNWTWGEITQAFKTGQIAMTTAANGAYVILENPKESQVAGKVGYAPPPMEPGGKDPLWTWGWGINKDSKNKEAAWLFIEWATSPTLIRDIVPKEYGCPARGSVYEEPRYLEGMPNQQIVEAQVYMLSQGINPYPQLIHAEYAEGADIVSKEMSNVLAGIKDVEQAAADADSALIKLGYTPAE